MASFVHLHLHSEYSVIDSTLGIKSIIQLAKKDSQPALALTDQMNMFAMVKFYSTAISEGIKPILGADGWLESDSGEVFPFTLLCQTTEGYLNLSHLISMAYLHNQKIVHSQEYALIKQSWLAEFNQGLIVLSGGRLGDVGQAIVSGNAELAESRLAWWQQYFADRYYLELVRTGRSQEENYIQSAIALAMEFDLPVVATNDVRFATTDDFEAHEVRTCIGSGHILDDQNRPKNYSEQQYFRTTEEMCALFADLPEALENTVEIAKRCNVDLTLGTYFLPDFPVPETLTMDEFFRLESEKGLEERLRFLFGHLDGEAFAQKRQEYDARLVFELDTILQMGFPGYFLIVADFIQWGKDHGVPVGPGRGSGAGSLVAYALKITDLDPLEYDLLFERFLNPERVSMPDFDVDFCMERRDEVIDYVSRHYGRDHVSQIVTFGTMAAKAVVRDVGRVLGLGYGMVDSVAKLIPNDLGIKLSKALEQEKAMQRRYHDEEEVKQLLDLALTLEGTVRNTGKHAGGVVIGPKPLDHFCPVLCEPDGSSVVTQLDKNDVETAGLVKFDFLGLRTLTIIDWALHSINGDKNKGDEGFLEIERIALDDRETFDLIKTGRTTGVFQLESSGMQNLIVKLKPDCFEDIIALVALFRPGPLESGMVDNFIARKHGREVVSYPDPQFQHDSLKPILEPTYGVILYQEQVMQIAQVLAGYTLGGADMLRRAMGKKKPEEMAKQRSVFEEGAIANQVDGDLAMKIFDLVEKFAGYGFNKSHSAAYALVSYQSAWLKTHYPAEFMAAQISSDMDNTDKVVHMVNECYSMGLAVNPPDINIGEIQFKPVRGEKTIQYGLGAIKGVGEAALEGIIAERRQGGAYQDLFDFCYRAGRKANKRVIEALIHAGALDRLHGNRQAMVQSIPMALQKAEQRHKDEATGQTDLFGDVMAFEAENDNQLLDLAEYSEKARLKAEKAVLGLYVSGHPISIYRTELARIVDGTLNTLRPEKYAKKWVAGLVVAARTKVTKSGSKMGFVALDDQMARLEVVIRPQVLEACQELITVDNVILVQGEVAEDTFNGGIKLDAETVLSLADYRVKHARAIKVFVNHQHSLASLAELQQALIPFQVTPTESVAPQSALAMDAESTDETPVPEGLPLVVDYHNAQAKAQLITEKSVLYRPDDSLLEDLHAQGWQVEVVYYQN